MLFSSTFITDIFFPESDYSIDNKANLNSFQAKFCSDTVQNYFQFIITTYVAFLFIIQPQHTDTLRYFIMKLLREVGVKVLYIV